MGGFVRHAIRCLLTEIADDPTYYRPEDVDAEDVPPTLRNAGDGRDGGRGGAP